jgi:hypothetical protein
VLYSENYGAEGEYWFSFEFAVDMDTEWDFMGCRFMDEVYGEPGNYMDCYG